MTIVLDTNVLVSGVLKPFGKPASILRLVVQGIIRLAYVVRIISEYSQVLRRSKFPFTEDQISILIQQIQQEGILVTARPLVTNLPDQDYEMFLEVAQSSQAIAIVTDNKKHFPKSCCGKMAILSPTEFLNLYTHKLEQAT